MDRLNMNIKKRESGFTLIEIAIVLVIIGLLLGGVLQGQQLIENSRVKNATNTLNVIAAAALSYQDRYGRMPGDDGPTATLNARGGAWTGTNITGGDVDGLLDGALAATFTGVGAATNEGPYFFQHLRAAGFITGDADQAATSAAVLPTNAFGGLVGVTSDATVLGGLTGIKICMSNVPGSAGIALDQQLDDGSPDTGRFRALVDATGNTAPGTTAAKAFVETSNYTVCYRI